MFLLSRLFNLFAGAVDPASKKKEKKTKVEKPKKKDKKKKRSSILTLPYRAATIVVSLCPDNTFACLRF